MKKIALMLTFCLLFSSLLGVNAFAATDENSAVTPCFTNTAATQTTFNIESDGRVVVGIGYFGYPDMVSKATITIKLEKRNLLFFWDEVYTESFVVYDECYADTIIYLVTKTGKYRVTVTYEIEGPSGETDVITSEIEDSY